MTNSAMAADYVDVAADVAVAVDVAVDAAAADDVVAAGYDAHRHYRNALFPVSLIAGSVVISADYIHGNHQAFHPRESYHIPDSHWPYS